MNGKVEAVYIHLKEVLSCSEIAHNTSHIRKRNEGTFKIKRILK
jgi:hypothetical protein